MPQSAQGQSQPSLPPARLLLHLDFSPCARGPFTENTLIKKISFHFGPKHATLETSNSGLLNLVQMPISDHSTTPLIASGSPCTDGERLEDKTTCARQPDQFVRTANSFHVKADEKYTRSVDCVVFMITGGRLPTINEMTTDEYGLRICDQCQILIQWI